MLSPRSSSDWLMCHQTLSDHIDRLSPGMTCLQSGSSYKSRKFCHYIHQLAISNSFLLLVHHCQRIRSFHYIQNMSLGISATNENYGLKIYAPLACFTGYPWYTQESSSTPAFKLPVLFLSCSFTLKAG